MAFLRFRTASPSVPTQNETITNGLSAAQIDGNFKSLNDSKLETTGGVVNGSLEAVGFLESNFEVLQPKSFDRAGDGAITFNNDWLTDAITGGAKTSITGDYPVDIITDLSQTNLFVVNRDSDNVSRFRCSPTGAVGETADQTISVGDRPLKAVFHPEGRFLYVVNETSGNISLITKAHSETSTSVPAWAFIANYSSSQTNLHNIVMHPTGGLLYVSGFTSNAATITTYSINQTTGALSLLQSYELLLASNRSEDASSTYPAEGMEIHPNGRFLYAMDYTADIGKAIEVLAINQNDGTLSTVDILSLVGSESWIPRSMKIHPSGKFLYMSINETGQTNPNRIHQYQISYDGTLFLLKKHTNYTAGIGATNSTIFNLVLRGFSKCGNYLIANRTGGGSNAFWPFVVDQTNGYLTGKTPVTQAYATSETKIVFGGANNGTLFYTIATQDRISAASLSTLSASFMKFSRVQGNFGSFEQLNVSKTSLFQSGIIEKEVLLGSGNNIDVRSASMFSKTITGATTFTVSNADNLGSGDRLVSFILDLTNGGSAAITWWSGVKWPGGTAPTLTASGRDVLAFYTHDLGTTWTGLVLGKDLK
jgi:6-phosphogluconolactonase (cycloisomerase 2 family)